MPPTLALVGYSGCGKTTLLTHLLPLLKPYRVGVIKHAHHNVELDTPGKDSYRIRHAGAAETLIATRQRWALLVEQPSPTQEPQLTELLPRLALDHLDLVLLEGFKHEAIPKIEIHRPSSGHPALYPSDPHIIAVASDQPLPHPWHGTALDLNDPSAIADFIRHYLTTHTP